ncbi:MAG: hypothetical protein A3C93_04625 [Candidatus Lloydbacteria bacterium RIFCSPHIGHO2_02_FULL_54_17]|uniref:Uncharacterized protein n=1 Tax=Candidatus Lloydbacteria bacterium RIFCSPHIGHO2_02_FULL_54_17 TaxID=1798664 RepID=A0A1G2DFK8_9BACT|nr:MAG: hypothetical protein A3C93_04625 [Candidatus Lloydbacteria bacterium RIFCSPHIGHO2_02_FULL_54_17]OGZ14696.1 MAG: hypothetical protein A2948_04305 [Candidatus Lloydbacteria bacterium RIFCSPLOWO2_01_FULL_54_18]OGZ16724.1 MAG: hypothetical protein A3H76_02210 [Candidatus Lloydbacteria bacterium RIFCSPLOWO2_02_FULL_54_12]
MFCYGPKGSNGLLPVEESKGFALFMRNHVPNKSQRRTDPVRVDLLVIPATKSAVIALETPRGFKPH